jgi:3-isopropylmalate/(R)-2-methylmalate dehydratase small subunit
LNIFTEHIKGQVWKFGDNISTDLMLPAFLQDKGAGLNIEERAKYCMFSNRPDWAAQVKQGDIVVARNNFGCGSSRPAATQLKMLGISLAIANSIARIFFRNAINLGFPVLICKGVYELFNEGDTAEVDIVKGIIKNLSTGKYLQSEILPEDSPPMQILRCGGIMSLLERKYLK